MMIHTHRSRLDASPTPARAATLALLLALGACTSTSESGIFSSDRVDYRGAARRTAPLDVPPDLTQLSRDSRYLPQGGVVSASDRGKTGASAPADAAPAPRAEVALNALGDMRIERQGSQRWIVSKQSPEALFPALKKFWLDHGFTIEKEDAVAGTIETGWAENRAKLPSNFIRDTLGKVVDGLFDSGLRDRYRTRLERGPGGTEITVQHFGTAEEFVGPQKDTTRWMPRESDPSLEAEMLAQVMVTLGAGNLDAARTAVASAAPAAVGGAAPAADAGASAPQAPVALPAGSVHARPLADGPGAALQVDDGFDRAWRRVGLALDHSGFTVEDRDRAQGLYFVRFVNAKEAAKEEPGFFSRIWNWSTNKTATSPLGKYRISVKANAQGSGVSVLNDQGQPDNTDNARQIVGLLIDELK